MSEDSVRCASALARAVALVRARLDALRAAISRELCSIPPPVPACDVNFNRLLEDRARAVDELQRLEKLCAQGPDEEALRSFCRRSACLDADTRAQVEALLAMDPEGERAAPGAAALTSSAAPRS